MTNVNVDALLAKFAEARIKRAEGPKVQALNAAQLQAGVEDARNAAQFAAENTANSVNSGYGPPYVIPAGDPEAIVGGGVSHPFVQRQATPWLSPSGLLANPLTNMLTGTSGSGLLGIGAGGALGYGAGKAVQNFDLFNPANRAMMNGIPDSSIAGMQPGALGDFYGRTLFGTPTGTGSNVRVQPEGGAAETRLSGTGPKAAPMSGSAIAETLRNQGIRMPEGGRIVAEVPAAVGRGTSAVSTKVPPQETPMFRERLPVIGNTRFGQSLGRRVGFPTFAGFRQGFLPGGVNTAGMRGRLPLVTGGLGALLPFLPNLYHGFSGQPGADFSPQAQTGEGRLDVPPELLGLFPRASTINPR